MSKSYLLSDAKVSFNFCNLLTRVANDSILCKDEDTGDRER